MSDPLTYESLKGYLKEMTDKLENNLYDVLRKQKEALITGNPQPDPFKEEYSLDVNLDNQFRIEERDRKLLNEFQSYLQKSEQNVMRRIQVEFSGLFHSDTEISEKSAFPSTNEKK